MLTYHQGNPLSTFIHHNDIVKDDGRICRFAALVTITTASNSIENIELLVSATMDSSKDFGRISFLENKLNSLIYPTDFDAKWQKFVNVEDQYLQITGTHPKKMIGKYRVEIRVVSPVM